MAVTTLSPTTGAPEGAATDGAARRQLMIDSQLRPSDVIDPRLLGAIAAVDREAFVPAERKAAAYADRSVPLGGGRALNAPLTMARLIADLDPPAGTRLLLIGAATGYTGAILMAMGVDVVAVEEDAGLAAHARSAAPALTLVEAPLTLGAPDHAPFDALLVDGAVELLPPSLLAQLKDGARIVTGVRDGAVTRLARGIAVDGVAGAGLLSFADIDCADLPGFAAPRGFTF